MFTDEIPIPPSAHADSISATMDDILVTQEGIEQAIDRLPNNSSPGPDVICPILLKLTKATIARIFTSLFQQSVDTGCVPDSWKTARVIRIFKSGDRSALTNYRPISTTSIPCKILEHIISSAITKDLDQPFLFHSSMGSCVDVLASRSYLD